MHRINTDQDENAFRDVMVVPRDFLITKTERVDG